MMRQRRIIELAMIYIILLLFSRIRRLYQEPGKAAHCDGILAALAMGHAGPGGMRPHHLETWVMLYSLHWCYIALTPAISIDI